MADFTPNGLTERIAKVNELFTLPDVIIKINMMLRSPKTNATDIAAVIASDMALSVKVLKLVNSAFYGFSRQITSINYAIVILGFNSIRNLLMSVFLAGKCKNSAQGFNPVSFWSYSISCAVATDYIAGMIESPHREEAFMAGLLNKIGIMVMNQYWPQDLAEVIEKSREKKIFLSEAERELFGFDHYELGAALLDHWNLPEEITEVCRHISKPLESRSSLCWMAHVANVLVRALLLGSPGDYENLIPALSPDILAKLGIKEEQIPEMMEQLLSLYDKSKMFLSL